jgi:hypothetical protein
MYDLQILIQRNRKIIARLVILLALGTAATLAILPRADAGADAPGSTLLSPHRLSGPHFSLFYPPAA